MLTSLRLQNFRSYADETFELDSSVNIIVGPNASGKTNLLEAVLVLCRGSSYRARDTELVAFEEPWARLDGYLDTNEARVIKLVRQPDDKVIKEYVFDAQTIKRLTLPRTVPVVLFEPNHLQLLHGSPDRRREYLDDLLEQLTPGYGQTRRHYKRVLAQRNALLKRGTVMTDQLFVWNLRLSELGGHIVEERRKLTTRLNERASGLYASLAQRDNSIELLYSTNIVSEQYSSGLLRRLEANQAHDQRRGFTGDGPHRDDLLVLLNGRPAQDAASRGESRTIVLALKLIELELLETGRNQRPLLLLDDVFSELDGSRRRALTEALAGHQTFITTTDADVVVQHFTNCHIIPLGG